MSTLKGEWLFVISSAWILETRTVTGKTDKSEWTHIPPTPPECPIPTKLSFSTAERAPESRNARMALPYCAVLTVPGGVTELLERTVFTYIFSNSVPEALLHSVLQRHRGWAVPLPRLIGYAVDSFHR